MFELFQQNPFQAYTYSYPHKTAYRPLQPPLELSQVWANEDKDALFLYLHVPFCEMRCGFCNLFTTVNADETLESAYLGALEREAVQVQQALGTATFARMAIGGGTPTYLGEADLHRLFAIAENIFGVDTAMIPLSVETSPQTATLPKLRILHEHGTKRVSIGVQSFQETEVKAVGRVQSNHEVAAALDHIRTVGFPTLNIDLIYGLPEQTLDSWLATLQTALTYAPEELYLYPLYQRPLTGLDRMGKAWQDIRWACYHAGRDFLLAHGYTQVSMRMFRAAHAPTQDAPVYCCQDDGMVGLGCGARSYTQGLHYSTEYAVGYQGVRAILGDYVQRSSESFGYAHYGCELDMDEQRRRYLLKSLLHGSGFAENAYQQRFGTAARADFPHLIDLLRYGLVAEIQPAHFQLTPLGFGYADAIGALFYSETMQQRMALFELE